MPKTKQVVELRKMGTTDLIKFGEEKRAELFALKFQAVLGSLEQTHRIKALKKEIARVELVLSEKKKAGENTNQTVKADYNKAVDAADNAGKKVRRKQLQALEDAGLITPDSETAIEQAMTQPVVEEVQPTATETEKPTSENTSEPTKTEPDQKPGAKTKGDK